MIPTWQGIEFIERVLSALRAQRCDLPWDLTVIDSGSTDGTLPILEAAREGFPAPFALHTIHPREFDHGDTRNMLAARSSGDLLVYLTQDAIPSRSDWLARLAANFADERVGAAYCRNVPRADARLLTRAFCRIDPGYAEERAEVRLPTPGALAALGPDEKRALFNFNDVASAVRRELWERHPFPRTMMGEDVLIARAILEAGYTVVYDAEATVDHSHDYGPDKMHWRGVVDARFNAEWFDRINVQHPSDVPVLATRLAAADVALLGSLDPTLAAGTREAEERLEALREEALVLRTASAQGMYEGGRSRTRYPHSRMRPSGDVRVLLVLSGALDDAASSDALDLAETLVQRGHRVAIAALVPASSGDSRPERFRRDSRVIELALGVRSEKALDGITSLVREERPDVVHFLAPDAAALRLVDALRSGRAAVVVTWDRVLPQAARESFAGRWASFASRAARRLAGRSGARSLGSADDDAACVLARADLVLCATPAVHEACVATGRFDATRLALAEPPGRGLPRERALEREAKDLEFRYRALACIDRRGARAVAPWLDARGIDAEVTGEATRQGTDRLLLRQGARARYVVSDGPGGPATITVEQFALASETTVVLAGRVLVDGAVVGELARPGPIARDGIIRSAVDVELPRGTCPVELEPTFGTPDAALNLRIARVIVAPRRVGTPGPPAPPPTWSRDAAGTVERLRVAPGPPLEASAYPKVAVVVPNWNGAALLDDCLGSLASLEYDAASLEVIVVDNGSTDGSRELLRTRYPSVTLIENPANRGFAAACNQGAASARAPILAFLNNDMRFEPDFLRELVAPIVRGECDATAAKVLAWDGASIDTSGTGTNVLGIALQPGFGEPPRPEHDVPRRTLFPCGGAMAIDAAAFAELEGFDEEFFAYYEDLDLGWRMWVTGKSVHYVPNAVCYHHHSHTSRRLPPEAVRVVMVRNSLLACVKNYDDANLRRVLPALLGLATMRAVLKCKLDTAGFRLEDGATAPRSAPADGAAVPRSVPKDGAGVTTSAIDRIGAADLIALQDLLGRWPHWMQRRNRVQSRRRRPDSEIFEMFLEPYAVLEDDPSYRALQEGLVALLRLDEMVE